jgi:hypothetical protein
MNNGILLAFRPHRFGHKAYDRAMAALADVLQKLGLTDTQNARVLQRIADQVGARLSRPGVQSMDQVLPLW